MAGAGHVDVTVAAKGGAVAEVGSGVRADEGAHVVTPSDALKLMAHAVPPDNDVETEGPPSDVVPAGWAPVSFSHALSDLVTVLANLQLPEAKRVVVAAAYMKVERVGMAACRAIDQQA